VNRYATWTLTRSVLALFIVTTAQIASAESDSIPDEQVIGTIKYWFVGHLGQTDEKGRLLVWEAKAEGDLKGTMKWWFVNPPPNAEIKYSGGRVTYYSARWELWDEEDLLLAGESAGKTNFRDGADGIWDGHGRVTEASGKYGFLKGRIVYETGPVILGSDPPKTFSGAGVFQIY